MKKVTACILVLLLCLQSFVFPVFASEPQLEEPIDLQRLAIYYSWPSVVNGANGDIDKATAEFAKYDLIVFADGVQHPDFADYANSVEIIEGLNALGKKVFGYVDLGLSEHPIDRIKQYSDEWKAMGAYGIFLDTAGYDYGVTRERQNIVVDYIHSQGMKVFMNAWNVDDVCGDLDENGEVNPSRMGEGDWYLAESWPVSHSDYFMYFEDDDGVYNWFAKAQKCLEYRRTKGIQTAAVSTSFSSNAGEYVTDKFKLAWWSAAMFGFPFQWTDGVYSSTNSTLYDYPQLNGDIGTVFTSDIIQVEDSDIAGLPGKISRETDKGIINIEIKTGDGKVIGGTGYFSPPVTVDGKASEWDSIAPLASENITLKVNNDLNNLYLLIEGNGLTEGDQFYFNADNDTQTGLTSWAVKGADFFLQYGSIFPYTGDGTSWSWDISSPSDAVFMINDEANIIEVSIPLQVLGLSEGNSFGIGYINDANNAVRLPAAGNDLLTAKVAAFPPASTNADLISLTVNPGTVSFDVNKKEYHVTLPYTESSVEITAVVADPEAAMEINGETIEYSGKKIIPLEFGENIVEIFVTAADNSTTNEYTIIVYRETESETNAQYPSITVDGDSSDWSNIYPLVTGGNIIKELKVTNDKTYLYMLVEGENLNETMPYSFFYINTDNDTSTGFSGFGGSGAEYMLENEWLYKSTANGADWAWSFVGILPYDQFVRNSDMIELSILLSDLKLTKGTTVGVGCAAYNTDWAELEVLPEAAGVINTKKLVSAASSSNADLAELTVGQANIPLESGIKEYTVNLPDSHNTIDVKAVTADANAVMLINGVKVESGANTTINLNPGVNTINISVTAENDATTAEYIINVNRCTVIVTTPVKNGDVAAAGVTAAELENAFNTAEPGADGAKKVAIEIPMTEGVKEYEQKLPVKFFELNDAGKRIEISSPLGKITISGDVFKKENLKKANNAAISMREVDINNLKKKDKDIVSGKAVVELHVRIDDKSISWKYPDSPIMVSIKYKPSTEELKDPEHITVYCIDGKGKITSVENGKYDEKSGTVTFTVTQISK